MRTSRPVIQAVWEVSRALFGRVEPALFDRGDRAAGAVWRMELETAPAVGASLAASPRRKRAGLIDLRCGRTRWLVRPELADELLRPAADDGLPLEEWLADGTAAIVKSGPHRAVYRLSLPAGEFYLKHYRIPGPRAALQNVIRPCKAMLEFRATQRVAACGIPTAEPVAVGRAFAGWRVTDNWLVTRGIPEAVPLHDFVLDELSALPASRQTVMRQQIATQLGRLAGRLHQGRLAHHDFHAGNVLVRVEGERVRLWLIDLHALSRRRWLSEREARANLASLSRFFTALATRSDRLRFFAAYWRERVAGTAGRTHAVARDASPFAAAVRQVEEFCHHANAEAFRRDDKKWRRANRRVRTIVTPAGRVRGLAELGDAVLRAAIARPEDLFADGGVEEWRQREGDGSDALVRLEIDGEPRLCRAIWSSTAASSSWWPWRRSSVAALGWEAGHALLRRRIPSVRPLLVTQASPSSGGGSLLLIEWPHESVSLDSFARQLFAQQLAAEPGGSRSRAALRATLGALADLLRSLHDAGFDHAKLHLHQFLVVRTDSGPRVLVGDPQFIRQHRQVSRTVRLGEIQQLAAALMRAGVTLSLADRGRFLRRYVGSGRAAEWKAWWRELAGQVPKTSPWPILRTVLVAAALAGGSACRMPETKLIAPPAKHSIRADELLLQSDFKLAKDHPLIGDLVALRNRVVSELHLPTPREQIVVYLFETEAQYLEYLDATYPGLPRRRAYFVGTPRELAVYTYWGERIQEDLRHEYTHGILHACLKSVPLWLDEGLAEYFEVAGADAAPLNREHAGELAVVLANGWRPDMRRLEQIDKFEQMQRIDYQEAWAWVHFMLHGTPEARDALLGYLADLQTVSRPAPLSQRLEETQPQVSDRFLAYLATVETRRLTEAATKHVLR